MKRLGLAAVLAVAFHAGLFWVELPLAKPMLPAAPNRAVTISLVSIQKTIVEPQPAIATPKPAPPLVPKPKKAPKPKPKPVPRKPKPRVPRVRPQIKPYVSTVPELAAIAPMAPLAEVDDTPPPSMTVPSTEVLEEVSEAPSQSASAAPAADSAPVTVAVPMYKSNPLHDYPSLARRRQYEGTVVLDVLVDEDGRVVDLKVARSSGYRILDRSAMTDVKQWRFEPARRGGRPFEMWVKVPVRYELR